MRGLLALIAIAVGRLALNRARLGSVTLQPADAKVDALRKLVEENFRKQRQLAFYADKLAITVDRLKGICASSFGVTLEAEHPWFWTLIGVDQALHHLTGFGLSIFMAQN